jgi:hypothetical protein
MLNQYVTEKFPTVVIQATLGIAVGAYVNGRLFCAGGDPPSWEWRGWHLDHVEADSPAAREKYSIPSAAVPLQHPARRGGGGSYRAEKQSAPDPASLRRL